MFKKRGRRRAPQRPQDRPQGTIENELFWWGLSDFFGCLIWAFQGLIWGFSGAFPGLISLPDPIWGLAGPRLNLGPNLGLFWGLIWGLIWGFSGLNLGPPTGASWGLIWGLPKGPKKPALPGLVLVLERVWRGEARKGRESGPRHRNPRQGSPSTGARAKPGKGSIGERSLVQFPLPRGVVFLGEKREEGSRAHANRKRVHTRKGPGFNSPSRGVAFGIEARRKKSRTGREPLDRPPPTQTRKRPRGERSRDQFPPLLRRLGNEKEARREKENRKQREKR